MRKGSFMILGLVCIFFIYNYTKKDIWEVNAELLQAEILSIEKDVETISLLEVTPFEWDKLYSFEPYTSKEMIYETIGYKWAPIQETVSEGMNQIVFLKDEKVVCYVFGHPTNNGYGIFFSSENSTDVAKVLHVEDDLTFQITKNESIVILENY